MRKLLLPSHGLIPHAAPGWRFVLAKALRRGSRVLVRIARRLSRDSSIGRRSAPALEFYLEAGAPEGALYANGEFVGHVQGVTRL